MAGFNFEVSKKMDASSQILVETKVCPFCKDSRYFEVDWNLFSQWMRGEIYIQDAVPHLSNQDTERFITGICPACWIEQFGEDED